MATTSTPASSLLSLLYRSYPRFIPSQATEPNLQSLTPKIFPTNVYSDAEKAEVDQWLSYISKLTDALSGTDTAATSTLLDTLNAHLATRTTVLGTKPSVADVAVYALLGPLVEKWTPEERTGENGYHHIVRHVDFVQNAPLFSLEIPSEEKINVDVNDVKVVPKAVSPPKDEKDKKKGKKDKKDATLVVGRGKNNDSADPSLVDGIKNKGQGGADAGKGKEKKDKQARRPKAAPAAAPLSPSLIDLRVGHIVRAIQHSNADSLFVSTIACGDAPGTDHTVQDEETGLTVRTVCSGLNGLIPLEEMQGRKIVTVCNLKPVTMRGIKSAAMVLAASPRNDDSHAGPVELVNPPEGAEIGERVFFEGWSEGAPEKLLNPKKKVWETLQPGFTTTDTLEVGFDSVAVPKLNEGNADAVKPATVGKLIIKSGAVCTVNTLKGAVVR